MRVSLSWQLDRVILGFHQSLISANLDALGSKILATTPSQHMSSLTSDALGHFLCEKLLQVMRAPVPSNVTIFTIDFSMYPRTLLAVVIGYRVVYFPIIS